MKSIEQMPANARVWVYTSKNKFDEDDVNHIKVRLDEFIDSWDSHGELVDGGFEVRDNRFVIVYASEEGGRLCGRAADASVRIIQELEQELETELLNRLNIAYKQPKSDEVEVAPYAEFLKMVEANELSPATTVYNNAVTTKAEFDKNWQQPLSESWIKQQVG
ncbi:MAG TPA: hypothetical protein DIU39_06880 [Flavobacteriales bacterium]|nr:hypothetical protein [Flavobacteriales bacterium]|tara:strand:+ start:12185 stop:12673 length:489 start_codon:yes stop_codon:yes gene_type:complete